MTSPYLNQPLLPLAIALPRMLAEIESDLAQALPTVEGHLRRRAELLRRLLTAEHSPADPVCKPGSVLGSSWSTVGVWSVKLA
jgi:hypothetical protein